MNPSNPIESSRFEELRNPFLADVVAGYLTEIRSYTRSAIVHVIEIPSRSREGLLCLDQVLNDEEKEQMPSPEDLRASIAPGRTFKAAQWLAFPITIFNSIDHVLIVDTTKTVSANFVDERTSIFAVRISALFELHFINQSVLGVRATPIVPDIMQVILHEIANSLRSIEARTENAARALRVGNSRNALSALDEKHEIVTQMIEDLRNMRDFSQPSFRFLSIPEVMERLDWYLRRKRFGNVSFDLETTDLPSVAIPGVVIPIVQSLFENAAQALEGARDGRIFLRFATRNNYRLCVTVSDNGPGILPHLQARVFEADFTTKGRLGTGLGLYLGRRLAESVGGRLELLHGGGGSTVFQLDLPAKET